MRGQRHRIRRRRASPAPIVCLMPEDGASWWGTGTGTLVRLPGGALARLWATMSDTTRTTPERP